MSTAVILTVEDDKVIGLFNYLFNQFYIILVKCLCSLIN